MVKTIVYAINPTFVPTSIDQVSDWAANNGKTRVCYANEDNKLFNVEVGAHITTTKGNNVYVTETYDDMCETGYKSSDITGIAKIDYPFEGGKPRKANAKHSIKNFGSRIKDMFMPTEADDVRIALDGNICVETTQGYVAINANNELVSYPSEMTIGALPAFIISKPVAQLQVGDVIAREKSYAKVTKLDNGKITAISYTGAGATIHTVKDFLLGQSTVRVVVSLAAGQLNGMGMNPMLLMAMADNKGSKKSGFSDLLPLMLMQQNGGAVGMNPMMLAILGGDNIDMKDMLMMSAFSGQNIFGNLFGQAAPVASPFAAPAKVAENAAENAGE